MTGGAALGPGASVHSLADVIAYNERNAARELQYFGQERLLAAQKKGPLTDDAYRKALARNRKLARTDGIDAALAKHRLDALVGPTGSPAWLTDYVNGDHADGGASQFPAVAGYPHITVPAGLVWGLPVGLSFFASAWSEPTLFRLAYAYEQLTKARTAPKFLAERYAGSTKIDIARQIRVNRAQMPLTQSALTKEKGMLWLDKALIKGPIYAGLTASGVTDLPDVDSYVDTSLLSEVYGARNTLL